MPSNFSLAGAAEWEGARFTFPVEVEGARPLVVLWVELPAGIVVSFDIRPPGDMEGWFAETLRNAMNKPAAGKPRRPARVRVADASLAAELRAAYRDIEIIVGPTPEAGAAFESLTAAMGAKPMAYAEELPPELVGKLFRAAEMLYRLAPWKFGPDDVIRVDIPAMGIDGACLAVIGQGGEEHGILLFPSLEAYDTFCERGAMLEAGGEPEDIGTPILSLTFETKAAVPRAMLRAIKEHGWPVAGPKAYPLAERRGPSGAVLPLNEDDARLLTAVASAVCAFFVRHRDALSGDRPESVSESFTGDDDLTVRLTCPFEDFELFEADEPARKAPAPGRNDPCHCGSGRKYKKCHLGRDEEEAAGTDRYHALDRRLFGEMMRFGFGRFGDALLPKSLRKIPEHGMLVTLQWAAYELPVEGKPLIDHFQQRRRFDAAEGAWIDAQRRAWLSIWEVLSVAGGRDVAVRDLLTGQTRTVREAQASRSLRARDAILARVVDHDGVALFCGMYARSLPPYEAAAVLRDVRGKLRKNDGDVPADRLRGRSIGRFMIERWTDAVEELDERRRTLPRLTNTDGDAIAFVVDRFTFDAGERKVVEDRLAALDDAGEPFAEGGETVIGLLKGTTVIAQVFVGARTVRVETNSEERAAAVRRRIVDACAGILHHRSIEQKEPLAEDRAAPPPPRQPSPEEALVLRQFKHDYYRKWMDEPIPMLGHKTPREAARSRKGRAVLDLLLRDLENAEASLSEGVRFDVSLLRNELGL